jgi:putative thioredoxin
MTNQPLNLTSDLSNDQPSDNWILDIDEHNFEVDVVNRSMSMPVVLYFHSDRAEPCAAMGPLLETEAIERGGAFILGKVNTDLKPELAQAFQIRAVPTTVILEQGRPSDAFEGGMDEKEITTFLDKFVKSAAAPSLDAMKELQAIGEFDKALVAIEAHLEDYPEDGAARVLQTRLLLDLGRIEEAREWYEALEDEFQESDEGRAIRAHLELQEGAGDIDELQAAYDANPKSTQARFELAKALLAKGDHATGLEHLLDIVMVDREFEDDAARKLMLETFEALGPEDEVANDFRYQLQMILFV